MVANNTPDTNHQASKWKYVWNHKLVFFLLLLLLVVAGWAGIKIMSLKRSYNKEKISLTNQYAGETARVFSWAIRSEMLRENNEQINQFFLRLVKEPGFRKIQLVDINGNVIVSTDKKDEGSTVSDTTILNAEDSRQITRDNILRTVTPVMGLNSKIGVLVIDREVGN